MLNIGGLAILVSAKEANIEIVARILEVIRVTGEKRNLLLRREHQANIGVALEAVKVIAPALIELYHIAAHAGLVLGFLFNRRNDSATGFESGFVGEAGFDAP